MDNKVLDEAVEAYLQVECQAINGDDTEYLRCSDRDREIVRAALLASLPVLLGPLVEKWRESAQFIAGSPLCNTSDGYAVGGCYTELSNELERIYAPRLGEGE